MPFAKKLGLRKTLILSFSFIVFFCIAIGSFGYFGTVNIAAKSNLITTEMTPILTSTAKLNLIAANMNTHMHSLFWNIDDPDVLKKEKDTLNELINAFEAEKQSEALASYRKKNSEDIDAAFKSWKNIVQISDFILKAIEDRSSEKRSETLKTFNEKFIPAVRDLELKITELSTHAENASKESGLEISASSTSTARYILALVLLGIIVSATIALLTVRYIITSLDELRARTEGASQSIETSVEQLHSSSTQLTNESAVAASALQESVASMEEITSMVSATAQNSQNAANLSTESNSLASEGEQKILHLISTIKDMVNASKRVEEITNVIDDISFQINLLSLNAAVEAARAGEQGRGFGVVAEAVRDLAQKSANAAKQISDLIRENVELTRKGNDVAETSGQSLKQIVDSSTRVSQIVNEISVAAQEQNTGLHQITTALNSLDASAQKNASSAKTVNEAAEGVAKQSQEIKIVTTELQTLVYGIDKYAA